MTSPAVTPSAGTELRCDAATLRASVEHGRATARWISASAGVVLVLLLPVSFTRLGAILGLSLEIAPGFATLLAVVASVHIAATFAALLVAGSSRSLGGGTLALGPDGRVTLSHATVKGGVRPLASWLTGWFDGTQLGLFLADGNELVVVPGDPELVRRAYGELGILRRAFVRKVRAARPGARFGLALMLPYAVVALGTYGLWGLYLALWMALWGLMAGPIGWIFTLLVLAFIVAGVWIVGKVASSVAAAVVDEEVTVGCDGVVVSTSHGRRFVDFREIASCSSVGDRALIVLADGDRAELSTASRDEAVSLVGVLEELRSHVERAPPPDPRAAALLTCDSAAPGDWLRRVTTLLRDGDRPAYRGAPIDGDALAEVLASPHSSLAQTLGAAAALGASGKPELVERVRIASAATADPDLRAALEDAALGELREGTVKHLLSLPRWAPRPGAAARSVLDRRD